MALFSNLTFFFRKIAPPWLQPFYTCLVVHRNLYEINIEKTLLDDTITHQETRNKNKKEEIKQKKTKDGLANPQS